jgi:nitrite reductase (NO-forming)
VVDVNLRAVETTQTIVPAANGQPAVDYDVWTFGGTAPGPVIRVTEGDTVHFTLTNDSSIGMAHSIDFHAAQTPWDVNYQPVAPGESASFDWVARFPGVFMYHCGVPPVLEHISNGMYGAIIVEPRPPLPKAREYVLVGSEFYPSATPVHGVYEGDLDAMKSGKPSYVVWNGLANQYQSSPLVAKPNELLRLWVLDAGPTLTAAFHVIGALFDHVYADGNPTNVLNGIQTYNVPPGGGAMFELRIPDAGLYPFVTHAFAYTGLGAVGVIKIDPNAAPAPAAYPPMGDPFSAGVQPAKAQPTGPVPAPSPSPNGGGGAAVGPGDPKAPNAYTLTMQNVAFSATDFNIKADMSGRVTLTLVNLDGMQHNVTVDALGITLTVGPNETKTFAFTAKPGIYPFSCSIPGHAAAGMRGTMTILPGMAH